MIWVFTAFFGGCAGSLAVLGWQEGRSELLVGAAVCLILAIGFAL